MNKDVRRFDVLNPVAGKDGKTRWTRIGVVFQNGNGTFSGDLQQFPMNGRVVLRVAGLPKTNGAAAEPESV